MIDYDLDLFFFGVLEFPRRCLEELTRAERHDLDRFSAQATRSTAAIHGGIADANDEDVFADGIGMSESYRIQPVDADMDAVGIMASGNFEIFPARRARADEDSVVSLGKQRLHAADGRIVMDPDAAVQDHVDFFVKYGFRQPERWNIRSHETAGLVNFLENVDFVAKRQQVIGDGERC